jgi:Myb-like DNA-binding protein FlbD
MQQQQPLPAAFHQPMMAPQFFPQQMSQQMSQQMYHPAQAHAQNPHQITIPQNMAQYSRMFDTPIPSPSGYSHMSAERAPSLISDCSSVSARSPHNGPSPIELPPLSGGREDRRHSSAPMLRLGVPGSFAQDTDFSMNGMQMQRYDDMSKTQPMLQEPFMPQQQSLPIPSAYLPSQSRQPSPLQQQQMQQHGYSMPMQRRDSGYPIPSHQLMSNDGKLDPALSTPMMSGQTLDGSPKDKMSLSNLTH